MIRNILPNGCTNNNKGNVGRSGYCNYTILIVRDNQDPWMGSDQMIITNKLRFLLLFFMEDGPEGRGGYRVIIGCFVFLNRNIYSSM